MPSRKGRASEKSSEEPMGFITTTKGLEEPGCQQRPGGLECKNVFEADVISVQMDGD